MPLETAKQKIYQILLSRIMKIAFLQLQRFPVIIALLATRVFVMPYQVVL